MSLLQGLKAQVIRLLEPYSQGAQRTYRAHPPPPPPPLFNLTLWFQMYLRVSRTHLTCSPDSHYYSPLRKGTCLLSVDRWAPVTNASYISLVHYFVTQWPKCSLKYAWRFLPYHLEQTHTKFKYSLEPGEGLVQGTVSRVSERSCNNSLSYFHYLTHFYCAFCFSSLLGGFQTWKLPD